MRYKVWGIHKVSRLTRTSSGIIRITQRFNDSIRDQEARRQLVTVMN